MSAGLVIVGVVVVILSVPVRVVMGMFVFSEIMLMGRLAFAKKTGCHVNSPGEMLAQLLDIPPLRQGEDESQKR